MEQSTVTPEEQKQYDLTVAAARRNIFGDPQDDTRFKMVLQRMSATKDDIAESIGGIAATTMLNISGAAQKQNRQVPGDILLHAGDEVVDDLIEIATAAKLMDPKQTEEVKKQAMFAGLKLFGEQQSKTMTPEQKQQAASELQQMKGAKAPPAPQGILASRMGA